MKFDATPPKAGGSARLADAGPSQSMRSMWMAVGIAIFAMVFGVIGWVVYWTTLVVEPVVETKVVVAVDPAEHIAANASLAAVAEHAQGAEAAPDTAPSEVAAGPPAVQETEVPRATIQWDQARQYVGRSVLVEGKVIEVKSAGSACVLRFSTRRDSLCLLVTAKAMGAWPEKPDRYLAGKKIQVEGKVLMVQGQPQINVESPAMIVVSEPLEAVQPKAAAASGAEGLAMPVNLPRIPWTKASGSVGRMVSVEGTIIDSVLQRNGSVLLVFSSEKHTFCALISAVGLGSFPSPPSDLYVGKKVRISGRVMTYEDRPQIKVDSADQISFENALSNPG